jgi:3-deoxy-manno-octulosonate cytidylyltransferase (CMP-KDO synthetase)
MSILGIIPARYASTRFPGKPLADIAGKSMLQRVFEQAKASQRLSEVVIATDDDRIAEHAVTFGGHVIMTDERHPSGTDRCYEALHLHPRSFDYVLNIQGDEPFLDPEQIDAMCEVCDGKVEIATQVGKVHDKETLFDPGEVKVVMNRNNEALYFSRSVVPFLKNNADTSWHTNHNYFRHIGMYAYRADILKQLCSLKPSTLELAESLEQLRWLENGYRITCIMTSFNSHCIDTPGDIQKVLKLMKIV